MKMTITTILSLTLLMTNAHADSTVFLHCSNLKNLDSNIGGSKNDFSLAIIKNDDDVFIDLFDWDTKRTQAQINSFSYKAQWGVENKNDPSKDFYQSINLERLTGKIIYTYKLGADKSVYSGFCQSVPQLF